jgi:capsular polysaccharide transport system permease protein
VAETRILRPPLAVSLAVWKALFLRETVARLSQDRIAWVWVLLEPIAHALFLVWMRVIVRQKVIGGMDPALFVLVGVLGFFVPRNMLARSFDAISQNLSLYSYRQIKPVDTILVRSVVEGLLSAILLILVLAGAALIGIAVLPAEPLAALAALAVLWFTGLGLGLVASATGELLPEVSRILRVLMPALYLISAIMFQTSAMPHGLQEVLLYNPLVHSLEFLRVAFVPTYQVPPEINLGYPAAWALVLVFLGLALHVRYQRRLIAR